MKPIGGRYRLNFLHKVRVASGLVRKDTQSLRVKLLNELEASLNRDTAKIAAFNLQKLQDKMEKQLGSHNPRRLKP
ncbi:MAG: hypothetical protein RMK50_01880 [Nitrososphaerota archaeon]|nr:hypothetical protein [Candidatus Bathyarchaeota archaeon]MDW8193562.1 hypothetical protein [Nitrososphaerota archaeon]